MYVGYFVEKCLAFGMKTGSENEDGEFWSVIESIPEYVGGKESLDPVVVEMVQVIGEIGLCDLVMVYINVGNDGFVEWRWKRSKMDSMDDGER